MIFDYYASLAEQKACPKKVNEGGLASGFADACLVWSCQDKPRNRRASDPKNAARRCYMKRASNLRVIKYPEDLNFEPDFSQLPDPSWFGIEVGFGLLTPWYSKDDRPFHVLDNPVRKDRVFGVPFMSAASWKGLLRWAFKMRTGMISLTDEKLSDKDNEHFKKQEVFLFGNERTEGEDFSRGALIFYPTWFSKVGFEVINPHKRKTRAGTQPIYYEVVPAVTEGALRLLYAPLPGKAEKDGVKPADAIANLIDGISALLETYGISAKRTAGWGAAKIKSCTLSLVKGSWLEQNIGTDNHEEFVPPGEKFMTLMDEKGHPVKVLLDDEGEILSKTQFKKLGPRKPDCTNAEFEGFKIWYRKHGEAYKKSFNGATDSKHLSETIERTFDTLAEIRKMLENAGKGGGR